MAKIKLQTQYEDEVEAWLTEEICKIIPFWLYWIITKTKWEFLRNRSGVKIVEKPSQIKGRTKDWFVVEVWKDSECRARRTFKSN